MSPIAILLTNRAKKVSPIIRTVSDSGTKLNLSPKNVIAIFMIDVKHDQKLEQIFTAFTVKIDYSIASR